MWLDHSLFIQSPTEGYLGCFQDFAIMNKVAVFVFNGADKLGVLILCSPNITGGEISGG